MLFHARCCSVVGEIRIHCHSVGPSSQHIILKFQSWQYVSFATSHIAPNCPPQAYNIYSVCNTPPSHPLRIFARHRQVMVRARSILFALSLAGSCGQSRLPVSAISIPDPVSPTNILSPAPIALAQGSSDSSSDYTIQTSPPDPTSTTNSGASSSSSDANSSTTATTTSIDASSTSSFPGSCSSDCHIIADALTVRVHQRPTTPPISSAIGEISATDIIGMALYHLSSTCIYSLAAPAQYSTRHVYVP